MKGKLLAFCTVLIATFIAVHSLGSKQATDFYFQEVVGQTLPSSHHSAPDTLRQDGTTLLLHSRLRTQTRTLTQNSNVNRYAQQKRSSSTKIDNHLFVQLGKLVNMHVVLEELSTSPLLALGRTTQRAFFASLQVMIV